MLNRLLPIILVVILVALIGVLIFFKLKKKKNIVQKNRLFELITAGTIFSLHVAFISWFLATHGAFLYLLHTDLCTMLYPWVILAFIFRWEKVQKWIMPWIIVGGIFELATMKMTFEVDKLADEIPSVFKHVALILSGIYIMFTISKFTWKDFGWSIVWIIGFIIYIILVQGIPYWVTGDARFGTFSMALIKSSYQLVDVSFTNQKYEVGEYQVLNSLGGYPGGMLVMYGAAVGVVALTSWGAIKITKENSSK